MVKTNESKGKNIQLDIISLCFHDVEALSILVKYLVVHKINMTLKMSHHKKTTPFLIINNKNISIHHLLQSRSLVSNSKC